MQVPSDYLLVKDKDGVLKYFKDGALFSLEEIENKFKINGKEKKDFSVEQEKSLKETTATIEKKDIQEVKDVLLEKLNDDLEDLEKDDTLTTQRAMDQKTIDEAVAYVAQKLKIQFSDGEMAKRFNNLLATYFRDIRTEKELAYVLTLPKISGGMEVPKDKASLIITVIDEAKKNLGKARRENLHNGMNIVEIKKIAPMTPALVVAEPYQKYIKPKIEMSPKNQPIVEKKTIRPTAFIGDDSRKDKPNFETPKKTVSRLIGPVEELETMKVIEMRQLGKTTKEIFDKIMNKFEVLESQGLMQKLAGQKAWKKSEIFQIYIAMTMQAMFEKKTMMEVVKYRQIKNLPVLMLSEYELIGRINMAVNS